MGLEHDVTCNFVTDRVLSSIFILLLPTAFEVICDIFILPSLSQLYEIRILKLFSLVSYYGRAARNDSHQPDYRVRQTRPFGGDVMSRPTEHLIDDDTGSQSSLFIYTK